MSGLKKTYRDFQWLPLGAIEHSFKNKWERSLLFYLRLKKIYNKPIFYNYSNKKIAELYGCSVSTANTHIKKLLKIGLLKVTGNNLQCVGVNKLKELFEEKRIIVPVEYLEDRKDHFIALCFPIIKRNLDTQQANIDKLSEIIKFQHNLLDRTYSTKKVKAIKNKLSKLSAKFPNGKMPQLEKIINNRLTLSNEKIGKLLNRTQLSGLKIQSKLNDLGFITSYQLRQLHDTTFNCKKTFYIAKEYDNSIQMAKDGKVFTQTSNTIILGSYDEELHLKIIQDYYRSNDFFISKRIDMANRMITEVSKVNEFDNVKVKSKMVKFLEKVKDGDCSFTKFKKASKIDGENLVNLKDAISIESKESLSNEIECSIKSLNSAITKKIRDYMSLDDATYKLYDIDKSYAFNKYRDYILLNSFGKTKDIKIDSSTIENFNSGDGFKSIGDVDLDNVVFSPEKITPNHSPLSKSETFTYDNINYFLNKSKTFFKTKHLTNILNTIAFDESSPLFLDFSYIDSFKSILKPSQKALVTIYERYSDNIPLLSSVLLKRDKAIEWHKMAKSKSVLN